MQGQGWLVAAFWVIFINITGLTSDLMEKFAAVSANQHSGFLEADELIEQNSTYVWVYYIILSKTHNSRHI